MYMGLFKKKEEVKSKYVFYDREKGKLSKKSIIYIIIMVLVGICIIFSLSTYLRWNRDIENKKEVLLTKEDDLVGYYNDKNEFVEVKELIDFYDVEQEISLRDNEAIVAYCGVKKSLQNKCVSINPSDSTEVLMRRPWNIVNFLVGVELLLLFVLLTSFPHVYAWIPKVLGSLVLLYGLFLIGFQAFQLTNYYYSVHRNKTFVEGTIVREIKDSNINDKFYPVIHYIVNDKDYTYYSYVRTDKKIGDEMTLYYRENTPDKVTEKRNPIKVVDVLLGLFIFVLGCTYLLLLPKKIISEKKVEKIIYESNDNS